MLHQIRRVCSNCGSVVGLFSSHTNKHSSKNSHTDLFPLEENQCASHPLLSFVIFIGPIRVIYSILIFVELRGQIWRSGGGGGCPEARNVNWGDCFNKALIFADAGRGLAGGATQTGGQLTVRYCQQT